MIKAIIENLAMVNSKEFKVSPESAKSINKVFKNIMSRLLNVKIAVIGLGYVGLILVANCFLNIFPLVFGI